MPIYLYAAFLMLLFSRVDLKTNELKGSVKEVMLVEEEDTSYVGRHGKKERMLFDKDGYLTVKYKYELEDGIYRLTDTSIYLYEHEGGSKRCLSKVVQYSYPFRKEDADIYHTVEEYTCEKGQQTSLRYYSTKNGEPAQEQDLYTMEYDEEGRLKKETRSYYYMNGLIKPFSERVYHYIDKGQLEYIDNFTYREGEPDKASVCYERYTYDDKSNEIKVVFESSLGNDTYSGENITRYDKLGRPIYRRFSKWTDFTNGTITYNETDTHGNWTKKTLKQINDKDPNVIYTRSITYYQ